MKQKSRAVFLSVAASLVLFLAWSFSQAKSEIKIVPSPKLVTQTSSKPLIVILHRKEKQKKLSIFLRESKWPTKHTKEWHKANLVMRMYDAGIDPEDGKGNADVERAMIAYVLGTAKRETDSFNTLIEYGGPKYWARYAWKNGNRGIKDAIRLPGRSYTQITGVGPYTRSNTLLKKKTGFNYHLLRNPDILVKQPRVAARATILGILHGIFTGKALGDYIHPKAIKDDGSRLNMKVGRKYISVRRNLWLSFYRARKVVNGLDHAAEIADQAMLDYLEIQRGKYSMKYLTKVLQGKS